MLARSLQNQPEHQQTKDAVPDIVVYLWLNKAEIKQVRQQDAYPENTVMQLKLCASRGLRPLSRATSPSLIVCL